MQSDVRHLRDLCSLIADCPHSTPVWTDTGFIVIRNQNIKNGRLDLSAPSYTDAEHFAHRTRRAKPVAGDIIFTREAPMGEVCMVPKGLECCVGQRQVLLRPNPTVVDGRFLLYALQSPQVQHEIGWSEGTGSTVSNVRIPVLEALRIPAPSIEVQQEVGEILGGLDDRIDLLRQANTTLESIAQALFKSWFIDFDPVRAKAEGREPEGMDAATAALFPAEFEESALGLIPKGWHVQSIGGVATVTKGKSYKSDELSDSDTALVTLKSFERGGGFRRDGFKGYVGSYKPEQVITPGECIVAFTDVTQKAEVIGRAALVESSEQHTRLVASLDVGILRPNAAGMDASFLYFLLQDERYIAHIGGYTSGTTVLHLAKDGVPAFRFALPPKEVLSAFAGIAKPLLSKRAANISLSEELGQLRDALLPRLISGKLRLPDAEAQIEEAIA